MKKQFSFERVAFMLLAVVGIPFIAFDFLLLSAGTAGLGGNMDVGAFLLLICWAVLVFATWKGVKDRLLKWVILLLSLLWLVEGLYFASAIFTRTSDSELNQSPSPAPSASPTGRLVSSQSQPKSSDSTANIPEDVCDFPLSKPAENAFIGRTPTVEGTASEGGAVLSVLVDGELYIFPAEREHATVNEKVHPKAGPDGRFSFSLDLNGDRVIGAGYLQEDAIPRGLNDGYHTVRVKTGSTQGVGSEKSFLSCLNPVTLR